MAKYPIKAFLAMAALLLGCGDINSSWENDGGGYIKYQINGSESYTIELGPKDVELTNYHRHYFRFATRIEESDRNDVIEAVVNRPKLGDNPIVGDVGEKKYSSVRIEGSPKGSIYSDESLMHFAYQRYLENQLRKAFDFTGTPIRFTLRERKKEGS